MGDEERKKTKKRVRFTTIEYTTIPEEIFFLLLLSLNYLLLFVKTVTRSKLLSTFWLMTLSLRRKEALLHSGVQFAKYCLMMIIL